MDQITKVIFVDIVGYGKNSEGVFLISLSWEGYLKQEH
jgi:hypothetical protein